MKKMYNIPKKIEALELINEGNPNEAYYQVNGDIACDNVVKFLMNMRADVCGKEKPFPTHTGLTIFDILFAASEIADHCCSADFKKIYDKKREEMNKDENN